VEISYFLVWRVMHKAILKPSFKDKTVSELKVTLKTI